MKTAFGLVDGYLKKLYGDVTPKLRWAYVDFLLDHRLNPDDNFRTTLPDLDDLVFAKTQGLTVFDIPNAVPEPKDKFPCTYSAPVEAYTPEFKKHLLERLDAVVPELEKLGLIDKAYVYGFDECGPEYGPVIKDLFGEVKRRYPKIHTCSTFRLPAGTDPVSLNID